MALVCSCGGDLEMSEMSKTDVTDSNVPPASTAAVCVECGTSYYIGVSQV